MQRFAHTRLAWWRRRRRRPGGPSHERSRTTIARKPASVLVTVRKVRVPQAGYCVINMITVIVFFNSLLQLFKNDHTTVNAMLLHSINHSKQTLLWKTSQGIRIVQQSRQLFSMVVPVATQVVGVINETAFPHGAYDRRTCDQALVKRNPSPFQSSKISLTVNHVIPIDIVDLISICQSFIKWQPWSDQLYMLCFPYCLINYLNELVNTWLHSAVVSDALVDTDESGRSH